jgi:geranyl-CoA carboxylase alpha subunit
VLEAMKMEFQLALPVSGKVVAVSVQAGQQVKNRQLLLQVAPAAGESVQAR